MNKKIIGFTDNQGKISAIIINDSHIELHQTTLKRSDYSSE
jgi:hypothetical protein